jgi:uncharacterized protein YbbC (DUF1343 family)
MPLPIRHGMTSGELARYFNVNNKINADLHVVRAEGWRRNYYFFDTGQIWVNPSPNMRSLLQAVFYPGVCLLERTNVSVGRGTDKPFEIIGAPWIDPVRLAAELNERARASVRFVPLYFTPDSSTHRNARCGGVQLMLRDLDEFHSVETGLLLVSTLYRLYPDRFQIQPVLQLLGNEKVLRDLEAGRTPAQALDAVQPDVDDFLARRRKALIYGQSTEGADESRGTKKEAR